MKITIHRGANQIGGCITEIATDRTRIFIDFGQNLPDNKGKVNDNLSSPDTVAKLTEGINAIIYTHYHGDHIGLFNKVPTNVTQYLGDVALQVMNVKQSYIDNGKDVALLERFTTYTSGKAFYINNDIRVTPYFVSHSACDSNMLLIEADGQRILHTGDFRDHGYIGKGLIPVINKYIKQVDFLITEGTMLSRSDEKVPTERDLMTRVAKVMSDYKYVFVQCSSTDMERLATFHKANPKGRLFVCDIYQSKVLKIFTENGGMHSGLFRFDNLSVFSQEGLLKDMKTNGFCMLVRVSNHASMGEYAKFAEKAIQEIPDNERCLIYSMWSGYVANGKHQKQEYIDFRKHFSIVADIHTSGHASRECLAEVCTQTNPLSAIIPIHSELSRDYIDLPISNELKSKVVLKSCTVNGVNIEILQ